MVVALLVALLPGVAQMVSDYQRMERRGDGVEALLMEHELAAAIDAHRQALLMALRGLAADQIRLAAARTAVESRLAALQTRLAGAVGTDGVVERVMEAARLWQGIKDCATGRYSWAKAIADHGELLTAVRSRDELAEIADRTNLLALNAAIEAARTYRSLKDVKRSIAEQKTASESIARNMEEIAAMADSTHQEVGGVHVLLREMTGLTRQMGDEVARFRT